MADDFYVNLDEMRTHAQAVGDIAANVRSVAGSASDSVSGGAFGQIAEFFASAITSAADVVRQSMNDAGQTVDQVKVGLNQTATSYQEIEEEHAKVFAVAGAAVRGAKQKQKQFEKTTKELKALIDSATGTIKSVGEGTNSAARKATQ